GVPVGGGAGVVIHEGSLRCTTAFDLVGSRQRLLARARNRYHMVPPSAAKAETATSEPAFPAESSGEINKSQPMNPKLNNRAARKTADRTGDTLLKGAGSSVVMLRLNSVQFGSQHLRAGFAESLLSGSVGSIGLGPARSSVLIPFACSPSTHRRATRPKSRAGPGP